MELVGDLPNVFRGFPLRLDLVDINVGLVADGKAEFGMLQMYNLILQQG